MRFPLVLLLAVGICLAASADYESIIQKWQQAYERRLQTPEGWLAVAGLFWLSEGSNSVGSHSDKRVVLPARFPSSAGEIVLSGNTAVYRYEGKEQKFVAEEDPIQVGNITLALLERNHRYAIRMRDPQAEARVNFKGLKFFPIRPEYRIEAKWVPYKEPRIVRIPTILGYSEDQPAPGYAEFQLQGQTFRLEPIIETPGSLFFIFKDKTAGHETYPAGRFLDAEDPKDGKVILDFNQARNPPCAFTAYATCPLPPKQNVMSVRIEAGELRYGNH